MTTNDAQASPSGQHSRTTVSGRAETASRVREILHEISVHTRRIETASVSCNALFPLTGDRYVGLSDDEIAHVDQLLYRFTKLQDAIGAKLFPAVVGLLRDDAAAMTVIDKVQVLEQAGVVPDADGWMRLREIRNQLAHDYEDDPQYAVDYLNDVFAAVGELKAVAARSQSFVRERVLTSM